MFLKVTGQRSGEIAGESSDLAFANQIDVLDWSWGMTAPTALGGQRTARVSMSELRIVKRADRSSTSLMSAMNANELLKTVILTVRKSGGTSSLPYFIVKLEQARIDSYNIASQTGPDGVPVLMEHIGLAFRKINVDYVQQTATGGPGAGSNFNAETGPSA